MLRFKLSDVERAYGYVSSSSYGDNTAVLCKDSGKIFCSSEMAGGYDIEKAEEMGELNWDHTVELPHKNELDLGRPLVFGFVEERAPDQLGRVEGFFKRRGAYGHYKDWLESQGLLDEWYVYESSREQRALREWCREHEVALENDVPGHFSKLFSAKSISPCIVIDNYDPTRAFYQQYFAATVLFDCEWYLNLKLGSTGPTIQFMKPQASGPPVCNPAGLIYNIEVSDVDAEYWRLTEEEGLKAVVPIDDHPWGDRGFALMDPNGITLYLYSQRKRDPAFDKYFEGGGDGFLRD